MKNEDAKEKLKILTSLALNNNLSKSEMNILYFCWFEERTSKEIKEYLEWNRTNTVRSLIQMYDKGYLYRRKLKGKGNPYAYKSRLDLN